MSSVAHQLPCFGVGFSLCLTTEGLFLCLAHFLWGKVSDLSAGPLLSACCDGLLIVFQLLVLFDFGCCSLAQEISFVGRYLPYFRQLITHLLLALLPFQPLFTESSQEISSLLLPPSPVHVRHSHPPLLCASFQFLVYSAQGAMLVYPRGGCGNTMCHLLAHLLVCRFGACI
jgi:hypothetical protein